ncbi:hypothetical protein OfM1_10210 [Lactovum odontotermitis]
MSRYSLIEDVNFSSTFAWVCKEYCKDNENVNDGEDRKFLHYRSLEAFNYILKDGKLRAYDLRFMNDKSEFEFGMTLLEGMKISKRTLQINKARTFIPMCISFSVGEESIPQWEMYAKEAGINLQFDFSSLKENGEVFIGQESNRENYYINTGLKEPIPVTYIENRRSMKLDKFKVILEKKEIPNGVAKWTVAVPMILAPLIKSKDFEFEHEARFVTLAYSEKGDKAGNGTKIFSDFNGTYLRSYVNLCFCKKYNKKEGERLSFEEIEEGPFPPPGYPKSKNIGLPIKKLQIGPGRNQEKVFDSVVRRLEFGEVKVCPISLFTFLERLKEYMQNIFEFSGLTEAEYEMEAERIKKNLSSFGDEQQKKKLINFKEYDEVKGILNKKELHENIISVICAKIKQQNANITENEARAEAEEKLKEFEKTNYFSWYGITVYTSKKDFSFV